MTIPVWVLLGFAAWTLLILIGPIGLYRWSCILMDHAPVASWRPDGQQGSEWYRRAVRAHMNCLENLPIYTAIVVALLVTGVTGPILDALAITILVARICQSSIHMALEQTNAIVAVRFTFFFVQALCMIAMGAIVALSALS